MASFIPVYWDVSEGRWLVRSGVKALRLNQEGQRETGDLSAEEDSGNSSGAGECVDIWKNTSGEGGCLVCN